MWDRPQSHIAPPFRSVSADSLKPDKLRKMPDWVDAGPRLGFRCFGGSRMGALHAAAEPIALDVALRIIRRRWCW